jgi:hypothetical protein
VDPLEDWHLFDDEEHIGVLAFLYSIWIMLRVHIGGLLLRLYHGPLIRWLEEAPATASWNLMERVEGIIRLVRVWK